MIPKHTMNPKTDHMDWEWVIDTGIVSDQSNVITIIGSDTEGYNIYDLDYGVQINSIVQGEGVEWYFCPIGDPREDYDEVDRFALKLNQSYCLDEASFRSVYRMASQAMEVHDISWFYTSEPQHFIDVPQSADQLVNTRVQFGEEHHKRIKEEAQASEKMQREAAKLDAGPEVGSPCIVRGQKAVWFIGIDKDGATMRIEHKVNVWWYGFETCIASTDELHECSEFWEDSDELYDRAYMIADECAMAVYRFLDEDIEVPEDYGDDWKRTGFLFPGQDCSVTYEDVKQDCFEIAVQHAAHECRDQDYIDQLENELTAIAAMVLDNYLEGYRDNAFKRIEHDIDVYEMTSALRTHSPELEELRERLYTVGAGDDLHQNNLGYFNGELVCIDFGRCSST